MCTCSRWSKLVMMATAALLPAVAAAQVWEVGNQWMGATASQLNRHHGQAVAVGDFDGDGIDDLAVGVPDYDSATANGCGRVELYRGTAVRNQLPLSPWNSVTGSGASYALGAALVAGDFDNDGEDEVAAGAPGMPSDGVTGAGRVLILDFTGTSFSVYNISQSDFFNGSINQPELNDHYGAVLAVGNFNNDSYDDLVVGVPQEDLGADTDAGMVHAYLGGPGGISAPANRSFAAGLEGMLGDPGDYDDFGFSLAAGDFDGDHYDDLAIGAPYRDLPDQLFDHTNAGQVHVVFGSGAGLNLVGQQLVDDWSFGAPEDHEQFGYALAAANFNQSPLRCVVLDVPCYDDLAIGVPGQDVSYLTGFGGVTAERAGRVLVLYGGSSGVQTSGATILSQVNGRGTPEDNDRFGAALAAGYVDKSRTLFSSYADLAVGVPNEEQSGSGLTDDGYVHIFFGSGSGIDADLQDQGLILRAGFALGPAASFDHWGTVLALGDLDDDGWGDLVVGVPLKNHSGHSDTGAVQVLFGGLFADGFGQGTTSGWSSVVP